MAAMRLRAVAIFLIARGITASHVNCTNGDPYWNGVMLAFGGVAEQCDTDFDNWAALWTYDGLPSATATANLCARTLVEVSDELTSFGVTWVVQEQYQDPDATFQEVCPKSCGICVQTQPDHPPSPPRPPPALPPTSPPPAQCGSEMDTASLIYTNGQGNLKQDPRLRTAQHTGGIGIDRSRLNVFTVGSAACGTVTIMAKNFYELTGINVTCVARTHLSARGVPLTQARAFESLRDHKQGALLVGRRGNPSTPSATLRGVCEQMRPASQPLLGQFHSLRRKSRRNAALSPPARGDH